MKNALFLLLVLSFNTWALGPHVHGLVNLDIASDQKQVLIMFKSPGMSVFGFAHKPKNEKQKQLIQKFKQNWEKAKFFKFDKNNCSVLAQNFGIDYTGKTHSEVKAEVTFNCSQKAQGSKLILDFKDQFMDVSKIHLQLMRADGSILNKKYKQQKIDVKL